MYKTKKALSFLFSLLFLIILTACNNNTASTSNVDRLGLEMNLPDNIEKIISLSPANTQILIDLGLKDKIIAVDTQTQAIFNLTDLPAFDMLNPNIESMIALDPDLIISSDMVMQGDTSNDPLTPLRNVGVGVAYLPTSNSIQAIQDDIKFIAGITGTNTKGEELVATMNQEIEQVKTMVADKDAGTTVYFEISPAPDMYSFGNGVFLNEMLEIVKAKNVFADQEGWLPVSQEQIVSLNPDVIFTNVNWTANPVEEILNRPGWQGVSAIANKRVYQLDNNDTSLPTNHIVNALKAMAQDLYNE
jgi:iron complex transport system substrate-binding protein